MALIDGTIVGLLNLTCHKQILINWWTFGYRCLNKDLAKPGEPFLARLQIFPFKHCQTADFSWDPEIFINLNLYYLTQWLYHLTQSRFLKSGVPLQRQSWILPGQFHPTLHPAGIKISHRNRAILHVLVGACCDPGFIPVTFSMGIPCIIYLTSGKNDRCFHPSEAFFIHSRNLKGLIVFSCSNHQIFAGPQGRHWCSYQAGRLAPAWCYLWQ
jgi:hypothetical protein